MAHDSLAAHSSRVHLTINGDELVWTIKPKGLQVLGLVLIGAGMASVAGLSLLSENIFEHQDLALSVRIVGSCSVATAGICLLATLVYLALRDGWARATVVLDPHALTVHEVLLHRSLRRRWSRDELKSISVGRHQGQHDLLAALKSAGMIQDSSLRVESTEGGPEPVLGQMSLNGELAWLAAILREHLNAAPSERNQTCRKDILVEVDPEIAERGGQVPVPLPGPHGGSWGTVIVDIPPGSGDGERLPLRGLGPGAGDLQVRLRFREPDERTESFELSRQLDHTWQY